MVKGGGCMLAGCARWLVVRKCRGAWACDAVRSHLHVLERASRDALHSGRVRAEERRHVWVVGKGLVQGHQETTCHHDLEELEIDLYLGLKVRYPTQPTGRLRRQLIL